MHPSMRAGIPYRVGTGFSIKRIVRLIDHDMPLKAWTLLQDPSQGPVDLRPIIVGMVTCKVFDVDLPVLLELRP